MKPFHPRATNALLVAAALLLLSGGALAPNRLPAWCSKSPAADDMRVVTLTGTLVRESHWGPPGFGENPATDSHFPVWVLRLDFQASVTIRDYPESGRATRIEATRMRIIPGARDLHYDEFINRHISVDGELWSATAPADVTPIVMQAEQIRISGPSRCDGTEAPPKI